jgi:hypothetical protein
MTDAQIADQHQTIALEMFPHLSIGKALDAFYKTELGKISLGYAAQAAYQDIQLACRCGDGDLYKKDDAGDVRGGPKVRHADTGKDRRKTRHPSENYPAPDASGPNREINWPDNVVGKFANVCDSIAKSHALENDISVYQSYSELLRSNALFKMLWRTALTPLPAE